MKKATKKTEAAKNEMKPELQAASLQKTYRDHKGFDHNHGRVNNRPFGMNHEPGLF